jgi:hypothetical protein
MIALFVTQIEVRTPFYTKRLTMIGGLNLQADHSHKYAKCVLINGSRGFKGLYVVMNGFKGLYVVMNEFSKILGWWFVNGTNMLEVEEGIRGINRRYQLHGFVGPLVFTTDRCCDDRGLIAGKRNSKEKPICDSLATLYCKPCSQDPTDNTGRATVDHVTITDDSLVVPVAPQPGLVKQLALPVAPIVPGRKDIAISYLNTIITEHHTWISYDSEWTLGPNKKDGPDVITIVTEGPSEDQPKMYLFQ